MKITVEIPEYKPEVGFRFLWEDNFEISTHTETNAVLISANKEGLISMARHLLSLAQENIPSGYHIHLDEYNSLNDGSIELIVVRK